MDIDIIAGQVGGRAIIGPVVVQAGSYTGKNLADATSVQSSHEKLATKIIPATATGTDLDVELAAAADLAPGRYELWITGPGGESEKRALLIDTLVQQTEAEPQGGQHRWVEQTGRAPGEALDRGVGGAAALHSAISQALRLGAVAAGNPEAVGVLAKGALGVGAVLESLANGREGERARGRNHASFGSGWPRK